MCLCKINRIHNSIVEKRETEFLVDRRVYWESKNLDSIPNSPNEPAV